jgi:ParB-like chromosome segregation protein Spo0J
MKITTTKIAELSLDPSNVRKHSRRNLDAIKASLRKFGQQKPIVVDAKGIVLAGNGTLTAAQELGWTEIQIVRTELAGVEATAFAIADNRTAELAEWDDNLGDVLQSLASDGYDLSQIGFDQSDLDALVGESESAEKKDVQIISALEVIAECENEDQQKLAYDLLTEKGLKCRLVTL